MRLNQHKESLSGFKIDTSALLDSLGQPYTKVSSSAYDTAWAARLDQHFPERGFKQSLEWLRSNQHQDGSWGGAVFHYHERIASTLSAMIALREAGDAQDEGRIRAGESFLWRCSPRLHFDANDTIGFPVIIVALTQQAQQLGLEIPENLSRNIAKIRKKLSLLGHDPEMWRYTTLTYSLEAILHHLPEGVQIDFTDELGCVGAAPASTAATLMDPRTYTDGALRYLENLLDRQGDGGIPTVDQIDIFETAWSLNYLRHIDDITPDHPQIKPLLDYLWSKWSDEAGVGFSSYFNRADLDDTAVTFTVLRWGGYPANADVFAQYEAAIHFRCYEGELDPSLSAQLHMVLALQFAKEHPMYEAWSKKLIQFLRLSDRDGYFWFDKWHVSPYYLSGPSIRILHGVVDDLIESRLKWLIKSQNMDGGWGYYGASTVEETAYCLQGLLYADQHIAPVDTAVIDAAAGYFLQQLPTAELVPLWIGKGLYTPYRVVQASIALTLHLLRQYLE
jgi:halimadienyl-diphosphate synthase